ncbi:DUF503 domain-containing protein [Jeotgalibaca arthritidis]|uniref:DUF503 domain-containing protein n=1 Tax=Jeotgalibaca arthritidis TaxID=1868794 RepID=A0A6G7KA99_9LACT|nr:DUF503 domain-containing protein [Jeotgalibaca arthritidis]QII82175.1 DUF503 domain-containing protein [Jeotgalibaca arthritidis]
MAFVTVEISMRLFDSFSLKDKRSIVKSILKKMHNRYNASLAEVGFQEMINQSQLAVAVASQSKLIAQQTVEMIIRDMENLYEVEIYDLSYD